jgi:hypothetical protein
MRRVELCLLVLAVTLFFNNQEVQAYINPGSGSYIFQTVVGGVLGVFYFFKKLVLRLLGKKENTDEE